jgi:hypothetical protein
VLSVAVGLRLERRLRACERRVGFRLWLVMSLMGAGLMVVAQRNMDGAQYKERNRSPPT